MKILVLGADGMGGHIASRHLTKCGHDVTNMFRKDFDALKDVLPDTSKYDYVINYIGLIKQKMNEINSNDVYKINSELPHKLAAKCERLIHISSDCVFSGKLEVGQMYKTHDIKDAEDDYGKSKAQGEPNNAMVLRTSITGPAKDNFGLFEWFRHTNMNPIRGFQNHWWSGVTTLELAEIINNIICNMAYEHGIKQVASKSISKYNLLYLMNGIYAYGKEILPVDDNMTINRVLEPDIYASEIEQQLIKLKKYVN